MEFHFVTKETVSRALIFGVQKVNGGNTVAIASAVRETLSSIEKELPPSIQLTLWFDKSVWIEDANRYAMDSRFCFPSGRPRDLFQPREAIRVAHHQRCAPFIPLRYVCYHVSCQLQLGSALAARPNPLRRIRRRRCDCRPGKYRPSSGTGGNASRGKPDRSKQICFTILSMTLSLVAVFIPLLFMPGINGRLFREFSITLWPPF